MGEVFSGFVCGFALAVVSTPLLAMLLFRLRASSDLVARMLPAESSAVGLGVILHGGLIVVWTMIGLILGMILLLLRDAGAALGSPNAPYSLLVLTLALAFTAPIVVLLPKLRTSGTGALVIVVLVFGWLMPHMAGWAKFDPPPREPEPRYEVFHAGAQPSPPADNPAS